MQNLVAIAAFAALVALPGAMALSTADFTDAIVPLLPPEAGPIPVAYVHEDGSVWLESNGCVGLQVAEGDCGDGIAADTLIVALPAL